MESCVADIENIVIIHSPGSGEGNDTAQIRFCAASFIGQAYFIRSGVKAAFCDYSCARPLQDEEAAL
jgi:hypothetical protein